MELPEELQDIILYITFDHKTNLFIEKNLINRFIKIEKTEEGDNLIFTEWYLDKILKIQTCHHFGGLVSCFIFSLKNEKSDLIGVYNKAGEGMIKFFNNKYDDNVKITNEIDPICYFHTPSLGFTIACYYIIDPIILKSSNPFWIDIAKKILKLKP